MKKKSIVFLLILSLCSFFIYSGESSVKKNKSDIKVKLVIDESGIEDKAFNSLCWQAVSSFFRENRNLIENYEYETYSSKTDFNKKLSEASSGKYDLIIVPGNVYPEEFIQIAKQFSEQKYLTLDFTVENLSNVKSFVFKEEEGAFLAGYVMASQFKSDGIENPKFGFIGGVAGPVMTRFEMGYIQGIKTVYPNSLIYDYYVDSWSRPVAASEKTREWLNSGVTGIFCAAGLSGIGAINTAKVYQLEGKRAWIVGVDTDQYAEGIYTGKKSCVITSMLKKVDVACLLTLKSIEDGCFEGNTTILSLKENGVDYAKTNPVLKPNVIRQAEKIKQSIINGELKIHSTYASAKKAGIASSGLNAKDK